MADNFDVQSKITISSKEAQDSVEKLVQSLSELTDILKNTDKEIQSSEDGLNKLSESFDDTANKASRLNEVSKSLQDIGSKITAVGDSFQSFGQKFSLYVTAPLTALGGLALREFSNAQNELNKLNISLANSGRYSKESSESMRQFADELSRVTTYSSGQITNSLALANSFARTNEQAEKLVKASADLAEFMGVDLNTAVKTLGQTLNGNAGRLGLTVKAVGDLTEAQLKAGEAIDIVAQKFQGSAQAAASSLGGQIIQLKNQFNDLLQIIGSDIAPYFQKLISYIRDLIGWFQSLDTSTRRMIIALAAITAAIGPLTIGLGVLISSIGTITSAFGSFISFIPKIISGFTAISSFIVGPAGLVIGFASIGIAIAGLINIFFKLKSAGVSTGQALEMVFDLLVGLITQKLSPAVYKFTSAFYGLLGKLPGAVGDTFKEMSENASQFADKIEGEAQFDKAKEKIDKKLAEIGTSSGEAFTFGISDKIKGLKDDFVGLFDGLAGAAIQSWEPVNQAIEEELNWLEQLLKDKTEEIRNTVSGNLASGFLDFVEGTKTASEAFRDFARNTLRWLSQLILQQAIYRALFTSTTPTVGGGGAGAGGLARTVSAFAGSTGGFNNNGKLTHRYAEGGAVSGPGSGTSDSILARLSNGEFVSDAHTVRKLGVGFFQNLKRFARSGPSMPSRGLIPAFANGGAVSSGAQPTVVIQNNGTSKQATSTEYDPKTLITTVVLEDLNSNGSMAKGIQQTFGVKRGGFR